MTCDIFKAGLSGEGVYLTVYPSSRPITDTVEYSPCKVLSESQTNIWSKLRTLKKR